MLTRVPELRERFENAPQLLARDARTAVVHTKPERAGFALLDREHNASHLGKFDRVTQKIDQHLPQALFVPVDAAREIWCQFNGKTQRLFPRSKREHFLQSATELDQVEVTTVQLQTAR